MEDLKNFGESISTSINAYFTEIGNRFFKSPDMNISLYDLPVILDSRSAESQRNFDFSASLHLDRAGMHAPVNMMGHSSSLKAEDLKDCISYAPKSSPNLHSSLAFTTNKGDSIFMILVCTVITVSIESMSFRKLFWETDVRQAVPCNGNHVIFYSFSNGNR